MKCITKKEGLAKKFMAKLTQMLQFANKIKALQPLFFDFYAILSRMYVPLKRIL